MIFRINPKKDKFLAKIYEKAMEELDEFFGLNWQTDRPIIFIVEDRRAMNALVGKETPDWLTGLTRGRNVYILNKENYEKESCHEYSDEEYAKLIKHELAHTFTSIVAYHNLRPKWLWEGLAIYLSGQLKNKKQSNKLSFFLENNEPIRAEEESGFAVKFLVEKYGKEKLLKLLKIVKEKDTKEEFGRKFRKIYDFDLDYKNFRVL